jgi:hypothetical protein
MTDLKQELDGCERHVKKTKELNDLFLFICLSKRSLYDNYEQVLIRSNLKARRQKSLCFC